MYAHPSFTRGKPELLSLLKKSTSASRRRLSKVPSLTPDDSDSSSSDGRSVRSASPPAPPRNQASADFHPIMQIGVPRSTCPPAFLSRNWLTFNKQSLAPQGHAIQSTPHLPLLKKEGTGRLDLLALAIEHEACLAI
jgi:hypothetical protein